MGKTLHKIVKSKLRRRLSWDFTILCNVLPMIIYMYVYKHFFEYYSLCFIKASYLLNVKIVSNDTFKGGERVSIRLYLMATSNKSVIHFTWKYCNIYVNGQNSQQRYAHSSVLATCEVSFPIMRFTTGRYKRFDNMEMVFDTYVDNHHISISETTLIDSKRAYNYNYIVIGAIVNRAA